MTRLAARCRAGDYAPTFSPSPRAVATHIRSRPCGISPRRRVVASPWALAPTVVEAVGAGLGGAGTGCLFSMAVKLRGQCSTGTTPAG